MNKKLQLLPVYIFLSVFFIISSCKRDINYMKTATTSLMVSENTNTKESYSADFVITEYNKGQNFKIGRNNMPVPVNVFSVLKQEAPNYDILSPISNSEKFQSIYTQAIYIGIYSADLTYCLLNENNQKSLEYFEAMNNLCSVAGVDMGFSNHFLKKMRKNVDNLDSMEIYKGRIIRKTKRFLDANENSEIVTFVVFGTWLENLYLLTNAALQDVSNKDISELIISQKIIIQKFIPFLNDQMINTESYDANVKIEEINLHFQELLKFYNQINVNEATFMSKEDLEQLKQKVSKIREGFISLQ